MRIASYRLCNKQRLRASAVHEHCAEADDSSDQYCKFGNFREFFYISLIALKEFFHIKNLRLGHDLPIFVKDSDFAMASRNFAYAKFLENKTLTKISEFTVLRNLLQMAACVHFAFIMLSVLCTTCFPNFYRNSLQDSIYKYKYTSRVETVRILISWLLRKPLDLDLHFSKQDIWGLSMVTD